MLDVSSSLAPGTAGGPGQWGLAGERAGDAHKDGFATVIRAGPFGDRPGTSKRVRVRFLDPGHRGEAMTVAPGRAATGLTGALFPVLDADISLTQQGHKPPCWLAGTCRPPPDGVGATLNKVILHRVATATIRALLERAAAALTSHAPEPRTQQRRPARPRCRDGQAAAHDRPAIPGPTQTAPAVPVRPGPMCVFVAVQPSDGSRLVWGSPSTALLRCAGMAQRNSAPAAHRISAARRWLICMLYAARVRWSAVRVRSRRSWEHCRLGVNALAAG
jgi:hypothetical protein